MKRSTYIVLLWLALPWLLLRLMWRSRSEPAYRAHWGERFGRYRARLGGRLVWIHAVSVGETRAAEPLVQALLSREYTVLMTHMTPGGRAAARQLFDAALTSGHLASVYLPYDYGFAIRRFLRRFQPILGIVMETEAWPNLLAVCERQRLPVVLVNARLSEKSLTRARRLGTLATQTAARLSRVAAQTQADAERFKMLGARHLQVTGNLKFDVPVKAEQMILGQQWRTQVGTRPVLLLASTREAAGVQEEALWLTRLRQAPWLGDTLLVIVPRHPQRFSAVCRLAEEAGWRLQRRSTGEPLRSDTQVWIGDSMGEMGAYYTLADLAFIGGSLVPLGGQNLIEACAYGCPVIIGPSDFNFAQAVHDAVAAGAAVQVTDADAAVGQAQYRLQHAGELMAMRAAAEQFCHLHRGATQRTLQCLTPYLH